MLAGCGGHPQQRRQENDLPRPIYRYSRQSLRHRFAPRKPHDRCRPDTFPNQHNERQPPLAYALLLQWCPWLHAAIALRRSCARRHVVVRGRDCGSLDGPRRRPGRRCSSAAFSRRAQAGRILFTADLSTHGKAVVAGRADNSSEGSTYIHATPNAECTGPIHRWRNWSEARTACGMDTGRSRCLSAAQDASTTKDD